MRNQEKFFFRTSVSFLLLFFMIFGLSVFISGCTAGNDYRKPATEMPEKWTGSDESSNNKNATLKWWSCFRDKILSSLVEKALENSHDIKMASARLRQSRALNASASSYLWPQADASASYKRTGSGSNDRTSSFSSSSSVSSSPSSAGGSEYDSFRAGFDASWELDFFGGNRKGVEAAEADVRASEEDVKAVMLTVSAETAADYLDLRAVQEQIEASSRNLETQRKILEITGRKYRAGLTSRLDYTSAEASVASAEAKIPELEAAERSLIYSIGVLTGEGTSVLPLLSQKAKVPPSPPSIPVGMPSDLLERRPDIKKAEAQLHSASARTGAARAEYFPKISLTGSFGYAGQDADSFLNWSSRSWSFGPAVSIPVFNAGRIAANIEAKSALEEQAIANYEKTVLTALMDVETALFSYSRNMKKHSHLADSAGRNAEAAEMAMNLYSAGKIDYSRVLEAKRSQYISEEALAASNGKLAADIVSLYKALGGGWNQQP